jgi:tetratricopeptide (TPR) repeat protein
MMSVELEQQLEEYLAQGRLEEAIALCHQVPNMIPDLARFCQERGDLLLEKGEFEEAIACYEKALKLEPNLPGIAEKLGDAFKRKHQGNQQDSLKFYRQSIEFNPYHLNLYHKALEIQPYNYQILTGLAKILVKFDKLEEAVIFYQLALITAPEEGEIHLEIAKILLSLGFMDGTIS